MSIKKGRLERFELDIVSYEINRTETTFNPCIPKESYDKWTKLGIPFKLKSYTNFYYDETSIHCKGVLQDESDNPVGEYEFHKELDKSVYTQASENNNVISGK